MKIEEVKKLAPVDRFKTKTGVYCIRNTRNGKTYVGSAAVSFRVRWYMHRYQLKKGKHGNNYLQKAWDKYGESSFEFFILSRCKPEACLRLEQYWMDKLQSADPKFGYNLYPNARSPLGVKRPSSVGEAVARANKLRVVSAETRQKMSAARKGKRLSQEHIDKAAASHRGKKRSAESIERMRKAQQKAFSDPNRIQLCKDTHWTKAPNADAIKKKIWDKRRSNYKDGGLEYAY